MGALSVPIAFQSEAEARVFVKRLVQGLACPCMRMGTVVLVICPEGDFEVLTHLAATCKGSVRFPQ